MPTMKFAQSARRHRVGRASARFVITHNEPERIEDQTGVTTLIWLGDDERGRELEIAAIEIDDLRTGDPIQLVTHVMPTHLRER